MRNCVHDGTLHLIAAMLDDTFLQWHITHKLLGQNMACLMRGLCLSSFRLIGSTAVACLLLVAGRVLQALECVLQFDKGHDQVTLGHE